MNAIDNGNTGVHDRVAPIDVGKEAAAGVTEAAADVTEAKADVTEAAADVTGNEEELVTQYARLVRVCARPYFLAGGDSEDLIQEGMLGLLSAVRTFDSTRGVLFTTYAEYCIKKRLISAIRSASSFKHSPLNNYISLESQQFDENITQSAYFLRDPEDFIIARESAGEVWSLLRGALSRFESGVLDLYLKGMSYDDMAARIGKSNKSVDNAVQRIRKKLAQILNNGDNQ